MPTAAKAPWRHRPLNIVWRQALTKNSFTKSGYLFAGWNTAADGSGTGYADKESVTFSPKNDGDSITLYAQWTQCTDHNWVDGKCIKCGALCSHSGGDATCAQLAVCETCGKGYGEYAKRNAVYTAAESKIAETYTADCGHTATADLVIDDAVSTVYTGSAIEALKVDYSDSWQGDNFDITYSNNVNVGSASGTITIGEVTAAQTFAITAATMTNVSAQDYSGTYDGQVHSIAINAPAGATVSYKVGDGTYSAENPAFTDAGTYTVAYKVSMANYNDLEGTATVQIGKAPLTVTANNHDITYGDEPGNNGVTATGFIGSDTPSVLTGTLKYDYTYSQGDGIGDYEIIPSDWTSNNYEITFVNGTLTVEKATAAITPPTAVNGTYNGNAHTGYTGAPSAEGFDGAFVVTYSGRNGTTYGPSAEAPKDAGNYTVTFAIPDDHTTLKGSANLEFSVAGKELTPIVSSSVSKTYDGTTNVPANHSLSIMLDGIVIGDDISVTASYAYEGVNVGDTKINATNITLGGADAGNYTLKANTASADVGTINKAPSSVTKAPEAIAGLKYNGQDQALITPGEADGGKLLYSVNGSTWSESVPTMRNPNEYHIYYKVEGDSNHTDWDDGSGIKFRVTIGKADALTVTIPNQQHIYTVATSGNTIDLAENEESLTTDQNQAIEDELEKTNAALNALENVEDVTDSITQLPETVEPDDEEAAEKILDAKEAYDDLTGHEKSLVDEDAKKKLDDLVAALTDYKIIKGNGGKWTKGSSSGLSFIADGPFSKFVGIEVDGKEVAAKYYDAKSGSTVIALRQSFLKRLSTDEHTITVLYTDGDASGTFKILAASSTPATGDDSNIMQWSAGLCVSALGLAVLLIESKKKRSAK